MFTVPTKILEMFSICIMNEFLDSVLFSVEYSLLFSELHILVRLCA